MEIFFYGIALNLKFVLFETRTETALQAIASELLTCQTMIVNTAMPLLAKKEKPIPT